MSASWNKMLHQESLIRNLKRILALILFGIVCVWIFFYNHQPIGPVDIVYTWVDGNDPEWQKLKAQRDPRKQLLQTSSKDADSINRYKDRQELRFSLRSLYQFAPFVNHIYIVTCGQKPDWIKNHPKITFIDHKEIFQDQTHLPTFNSQAIEAHLHRIKGLSEHYIYLNDDFLITAPVTADDFYDPSGKVKIFFSKNFIPKGKPKNAWGAYAESLYNCDVLLDKTCIQEDRYELAHAPYVMKKSVVYACEQHFPTVFTETSSHPFRCNKDYTIVNGLIPYYALYNDLATPGSLKSAMIFISKHRGKNRGRLQMLSDETIQIVCVEDVVTTTLPAIDRQVIKTLNNHFPQRAPWEKGRCVIPPAEKTQ